MGWTGDWSFHFMVSDDKFHFPLYLSSWPLWRRPVIIAKARSFALLVVLSVGLSVSWDLPANTCAPAATNSPL